MRFISIITLLFIKSIFSKRLKTKKNQKFLKTLIGKPIRKINESENYENSDDDDINEREEFVKYLIFSLKHQMIWGLNLNMLNIQMIKKVIFNFKKIKIMIQMN